MKELICKIIRKKGMLYFIDKNGCVWEQELNKGRSKKTIAKIKKLKEQKENERYF